MTDTTPDAAERLAEALEQLDAFAEDFLKADRPFTAAIMRSIAALIRAQAAEIARHPAALQEARNAALREAAEATKGEGESEFFNPVQAIRALIDTPAPPALAGIQSTGE